MSLESRITRAVRISVSGRKFGVHYDSVAAERFNEQKRHGGHRTAQEIAIVPYNLLSRREGGVAERIDVFVTSASQPKRISADCAKSWTNAIRSERNSAMEERV
jgi:hypothetical protein